MIVVEGIARLGITVTRRIPNLNGLSRLFGFFVDRVLVAMGTEFFQFQPCRGVTTVFHGGIAVNAVGSLIGVAATLGTF
jgi:hypothetical protein